MSDLLPLELLLRTWPGFVLAGVWGLLWGSFCNVCIHRVPRGESVVLPASHCPSCQAPLSWYDTLPLLSWLALLGRCRRCKGRISVRYPLIELVSAGLALWTFRSVLVEPMLPLSLTLARFLLRYGLAAVLLVLSAIDLEHQRIPDRITYPAIPLAFLLGRLDGYASFWQAGIGLAGGYLLIRVISDGYYYLTGREGLGYGDGKLLAIAGAYLGYRALPWILLIASVSGALILLGWALGKRLLHGPTEARLREVQVPFGPFLSLGTLAYLLVGASRPIDAVLLSLVERFLDGS